MKKREQCGQCKKLGERCGVNREDGGSEGGWGRVGRRFEEERQEKKEVVQGWGRRQRLVHRSSHCISSSRV